jgi:hypothetical protein
MKLWHHIPPTTLTNHGGPPSARAGSSRSLQCDVLFQPLYNQPSSRPTLLNCSAESRTELRRLVGGLWIVLFPPPTNHTLLAEWGQIRCNALTICLCASRSHEVVGKSVVIIADRIVDVARHESK